MSVYIPTHNRYNTILEDTLSCYTGDVELLVHTKRQKRLYENAGVNFPIHITGICPEGCGKAHSMRWALDKADEGEWVWFLDDDILNITMIPEPHYQQGNIPISVDNQKQLSSIFNQVPNLNRLHWGMENTLKKAEEIGAYIAGVSVVPNPLFRSKRWGTYVNVWGEMMAIKKRKDFPYPLRFIDDIAATGFFLLQDGVVLVDRWICVKAKKFSLGGLGTLDENRKQRYEQDAKRLLKEQPELWRIKNKKYGRHTLKELRLKPSGQRFLTEIHTK